MNFETNTPKVVISDKAPPVLQCRNDVEVAACKQLLSMLRRGKDPIAFISRHVLTGEIEVEGRSSTFTSISDMMRIFDVAKAKLAHTLFRKKMPTHGG